MSTFRGKAKRRARAVRKATGRVMVPLGPSPRAPYGTPPFLPQEVLLPGWAEELRERQREKVMRRDRIRELLEGR